MNFYTMQMHQDHEAFDNVSIYETAGIIAIEHRIGFGSNWEDDPNNAIGRFKDNIQIGDIVAIKKGGTPIALVEVISEAKKDDGIKLQKINWLDLYRDVKVLGFYSDYNKEFKFNATRGTLSLAHNEEDVKNIQEWYEFCKNK